MKIFLYHVEVFWNKVKRLKGCVQNLIKHAARFAEAVRNKYEAKGWAKNCVFPFQSWNGPEVAKPKTVCLKMAMPKGQAEATVFQEVVKVISPGSKIRDGPESSYQAVLLES